MCYGHCASLTLQIMQISSRCRQIVYICLGALFISDKIQVFSIVFWMELINPEFQIAID